MSSEITTNSQLSTTEPEKKKKQMNRNRITEMEITWRFGGGWKWEEGYME